MGVLVSYAYITRESWLSVTRGRFLVIFPYAFCAVVFAGTLIGVEFIFNLADIINAGMLLINLFGIIYLVPVIKKGLQHFKQS